MEIVSKIM